MPCCLNVDKARRVTGRGIPLGFLLLTVMTLGADPQSNSVDRGPAALKNLSLEELSQIEVTTPSKTPTRAFQTPAAIAVITGEDIKRSGALSIPEALRLAPGVEVARIDGNKAKLISSRYFRI